MDEMRGNILSLVHEGMDVFDPNGERIGKVAQVFLGSVGDSEADMGLGAAEEDRFTQLDRNEKLFPNLIAAMGATEKEADVVKARLEREGFVEVDRAGLFASNAYALPDQIRSVSDDGVHLKVDKSSLIETE